MSVASVVATLRRWKFRHVTCVCLLLAIGCGDDATPALDLQASGEYGVSGDAKTFDPPSGDVDPIEGKLWLPLSAEGTPESQVALVVFAPTLGVGWDAYELLLEHLVSHGYAVLAIDLVEQGRDHERQALRVLHATQQAVNAEPDAIDSTRIALLGHSIGGKLALLAATLDHPLHASIATVIAWDPIDSDNSNESLSVSVAPELMPDVTVPTLIFGTPVSACVLAGNNHDDIFAAARSPSLHLVFPTADHVDWGDDFGEGVYGFGIASMVCNRIGELNGYFVHQVTRRAQIAWLKKHVDREPGMDRYLTGADAPEVRSGIVIATGK